MKKNKHQEKRAQRWLLSAAAVGATLPIITNQIAFQKGKKYNFSLDGMNRCYIWHGLPIHYAMKGHGAPVLLVHGIAPGCDSYTFRHNFNYLSKYFTVYAIDLLGYGLSAAPDIRYTSDLYSELIAQFIQEVIGYETDLVAAGLSCAYAIRAARAHSDLIHKLVCIHPSGILNRNEKKERPMVTKLFRSPYLGTTMYNRICTKRKIRHFLTHYIYDDASIVTKNMIRHYYYSAHVKGVSSKYATAAFLGQQCNETISFDLACLDQPILAIWGQNGALSVSEEWKHFEEVNENITTKIYDACSILPNDESCREFNRDVTRFFIT